MAEGNLTLGGGNLAMRRRAFLQTAGGFGLAAGLSPKAASGIVPEHNWEKHDWGAGPTVKDRLYQGPFPQYPPEVPVVPGSEVVMVTTPSREIVPNYGMGLTVYVSGVVPIADLVPHPAASVYPLRPGLADIVQERGELEKRFPCAAVRHFPVKVFPDFICQRDRTCNIPVCVFPCAVSQDKLQ